MASSEEQVSSDEYEDVTPLLKEMMEEDDDKPKAKITVRRDGMRSGKQANRSAMSLAGLDDAEEEDTEEVAGARRAFASVEEREEFLELRNSRKRLEQRVAEAREDIEDLRMEREVFEEESLRLRAELQGKQDVGNGEVAKIQASISSLGRKRDALVTETERCKEESVQRSKVIEDQRKENLDLQKVIDDQRKESYKMAQKIKEGAARLRQMEADAVALTEKTKKKKEEVPDDGTEVPLENSTPKPNKPNASREQALKRLAGEIEKDVGFASRLSTQIDTIVTKRLSGMLKDVKPRGSTSDLASDNDSSDSCDSSIGRKKRSATPRKSPNKSRCQSETPLKVRRRQTMLPDEIKIFESNPTIARLGLDAMAGKEDQATAVEWSKDRVQQLHDGPRTAIPAKKHAVNPKPFDGNISWKKWFSRFCEDMATNGWSDGQILGSLMECLRDGPGEDALWTFEENGDGTLQCLVTTAAWICGPLHGDDPGVELETRRQKKGESFRKFGMALRRLAKEAFEGLSPSEPWLVRKLAQLFIDGLEDTSLSQELAYHWKTDMSLNELFKIADDCNRKKVLLRTPSSSVALGGTVSAADEEWEPPAEEVAAYAPTRDRQSKDREAGRGRGRGRGKPPKTEAGDKVSGEASVGPDLIAAIKKIVVEALGRGRGRGRGSKETTACFKCQKTGHWARECPTKRTVASAEEAVDQFEEAPEATTAEN